MIRFRIPHAALAAALLVAAVSSGGCGPDPTEPRPRPVVHRTVTAVVRDSLGVPIAHAETWWVALEDSAGLAEVRVGVADANGEAVQVLREGGWIVTASGGALAAGASFRVNGPERAAVDTQVVRAVAHTPSRATGTCTLGGAATHAGTLVAGLVPGMAMTDAAGAWVLEGLPLGRWPVTLSHPGYRDAFVEVVVTVPGSTVATSPVRLPPEVQP